MSFKKRIQTLNSQKFIFIIIIIIIVYIFSNFLSNHTSNIKQLIPESNVNLRTILFTLTTISVTAITISTIILIIKMFNKTDDLHDFYEAKADMLLKLDNLQKEAQNLGSEFEEKLFLKKLKVISQSYPNIIKKEDKEIKLTELLQIIKDLTAIKKNLGK